MVVHKLLLTLGEKIKKTKLLKITKGVIIC